MKVIVEYDENTGEIKDTTDCVIAVFYSLQHFGKADEPIVEEQKQTNSINDMIKLKGAGFTAEEIIALQASK